MRHLDLFSGIGGFALAAERVWPNITHTFVDNDPFCQEVLKKHWPQAEIHGDIRSFTNTNNGRLEKQGAEQQTIRDRQSYENTRTYLLTGGFPCQPFSQAGRRKGTADDRHLWPEMLRVIREFKPRWVIGENVGGFVTWSEGLVLEQVHADLEGEGYEVQAFIIPAVAVNAPHRRDRVWIVANNRHGDDAGDGKPGNARAPKERRTATQSEQSATDGGTRDASNTESTERERFRAEQSREQSRLANESWNEPWLEVATRLCTVDDGLPNGLVRPRGWRNAALKAAGNAIVPQVAEEIMKKIKEIDQ